MDRIPHSMFNWRSKSSYAMQKIPDISDDLFEDIKKSFNSLNYKENIQKM